MTDSKRITIFFTSLIGLLSLTLLAAVVANAGVWRQGIPLAWSGDSCSDVLDRMTLSQDDIDAYGYDRTTPWTESWAEWANNGEGGAVCIREVDDPSQPAPAPAENAAPTPSGPQYAWVRLGTVTLIPGQNGAGSLPVNGCATNPSGLYTGSPLDIRASDPSVVVTWYPDTLFYVLRNPTTNTITSVVEVSCQLR